MENRRISWNSPGKSRIIDIIKYISCRVSYIPLFFLILILNSYSLEVKVVDNVNVKNIHDDIISSVSLGEKSISEDLEFSGLEGITVIIERRPEKTDRVAYALPEKNTIVIYYPFEFNTFPYSNLNTVIYHEISHIILYHKAGPRTRLPLWFHEGIAMHESKELYPFIAFKVTGILYSDKPSAIVDHKMVHEWDTVHGVAVIKIYEDKVKFQKDGKRWEQKVRQTPATYWK